MTEPTNQDMLVTLAAAVLTSAQVQADQTGGYEVEEVWAGWVEYLTGPGLDYVLRERLYPNGEASA